MLTKARVRPAAAVLFVVLVIAGCSSATTTTGGTYVLAISASSGTLSGTGVNWSFDAGGVPQYATESITFTVTNTGSVAFTAQGTTSFTSGDFATNLSGSFTVQPQSSNSFVGTFTPTGSSPETGTLTLTPSNGNPAIVVSLSGTPDQSFVIQDATSSVITSASPPVSVGGINYQFTVVNNGASTITLSGSPNCVTTGTAVVFTVSTQPATTIGPTTQTPFNVNPSSSSYLAVDTITVSGMDAPAGGGPAIPFMRRFQAEDTWLS